MPDATLRLADSEQKDCLKLNPFDGDFGSQRDRIFSDRVCVARKRGGCHICCGAIQPGEHQRRHEAKYDDEMRTYRWCHLCCKAMARSWTDDGVSLEDRYALRRTLSAEQHGGAA